MSKVRIRYVLTFYIIKEIDTCSTLLLNMLNILFLVAIVCNHAIILNIVTIIYFM